ncbi:hypothetical protein [Xanthomonas vesicatoria]|uniref:Uncharacterized protein n=1 Tax=Xanthomonas vesicatoria TaxID=56460 RepID=A0ABS8L6J5_9XANT|nr:hypothetical protein [Xanthomonas vesicatoria]MCC8558395.1 hypothetical protein [Xanthomonas vesicatoria]MCC8595663.1 hypothetical protein [Xanthomonas vesicatoria]MCC8601513.1 hypothetical protein [Xanthomonas vesicatoria]MCC8608198.1 hypothetical protein [Xanthomonas vesicatoria]MCC8621360.1 hypothetical protein [Xanthomonas vesicatoria]
MSAGAVSADVGSLEGCDGSDSIDPKRSMVRATMGIKGRAAAGGADLAQRDRIAGRNKKPGRVTGRV